MKKTISIFLAALMLFSCFSVLSVSAETGDLADIIYSEETIEASRIALKRLQINGLERFDFSFEDRKNASNSAKWNKVNLLGMNLDFLYSSDSSFIWSQLDIYQKNEDGSIKYDADKNPLVAITLDDISLAFTNLNIYLQRVLYKQYGGLNLYNVNNAVSLANAIGKALRVDFNTLDVNNYKGLFSNEVPSANEFFDAVTRLSGLGEIVSQNWVPKGKSYIEPIVNLLGGGYIGFLDDYYTDGYKLASKILEGAVTKFNSVGVIEYLYDLLDAFTSEAYYSTYGKPLLALFSMKTASLSEYMTEEELRSFDGLLHLIFCDCNPVAQSGNGAIAPEGCYSESNKAVDHFVPFKFPVERYRKATNKNEKLLYLYYYLNVAGHYKSNIEYFKGVQDSIYRNVSFSADDQNKLCAIIDGFFLGDFDSAVEDAIVPLYKENISTAGDGFFERFKNAFMIFMKKIADYFDYLRKLFSGEIQYGQGNSPFN